MIAPIAFILPTRDRAAVLERFLETARAQDVLPAEIVVVDASRDDSTERLLHRLAPAWPQEIRWTWQRAARVGLAPQRNQAVEAATQPYVLFLDDDIELAPGCLRALHEVVSGDPACGGATATIVNEPYHPPGRATRGLMRWFEHGVARPGYASACVGPGWTFMHDPAGPELTRAEWMGGGCTLYRKAALPVPAVPAHFEEGALGEDLAASLQVAKQWKTWHVRAARCVHNSQGGAHKRSLARLADQGLRNRHWIMTRVMGRREPRDHFDFALMHLFRLLGMMASIRSWPHALPCLAGWLRGAARLCREGHPA